MSPAIWFTAGFAACALCLFVFCWILWWVGEDDRGGNLP